MPEVHDTGTAQAFQGVVSVPGEPDGPHYDSAFFEALEEGSARSAAIVADLLVSALGPRSVIDVGCGTGRWLAAFRELGVTDTLGLDGPWVEPAQFAGPPESFRSLDLALPIQVNRRFDLALCLEAAEHLPPERASGLVEDLVGLAPVILFSAAIPGQVGEGHINERWPSYWRDLFATRGYDCDTSLREQLWHRDEVEVWYRQNLLVLTVSDRTKQVGKALRDLAVAEARPLDLVHPDLYARERRNVENWSLHAAYLGRQLNEALAQVGTAQAAAEAIAADLKRHQASLEHRIGRWVRRAIQKAYGHR